MRPGIALVHISKFWFLDRMIWLWNDKRDAIEEYRGWTIPQNA